ncbi:hypothetical protein P7C70_g4305, partial [Phenoliferia sp. Uapishka_3]
MVWEPQHGRAESQSSTSSEPSPPSMRMVDCIRTTLEASSFQYLLSPALYDDLQQPSRERRKNALMSMGKERDRDVGKPEASISKDRPVVSSGPGKKRGRPKKSDLASQNGIYDGYGSYDEAPQAKVSKKDAKTKSHPKKKTESPMISGEVDSRPHAQRQTSHLDKSNVPSTWDDDNPQLKLRLQVGNRLQIEENAPMQQQVGDVRPEVEQRPYGTRRLGARKQRSRSSSAAESLNSEDFLMNDSEDEAAVAASDDDDEPDAPSSTAPAHGPRKTTDFGQKWSAKDDSLLRRLGPRSNGESWLQIAEFFPNRTLRGVKQRWRNLIKLGQHERSPSIEAEVNTKSATEAYSSAILHRASTRTPEEEDAEREYESYESEDDEGAREQKDGRGAQGAKWTPEDDAKLMELAAGRKMGESWVAISAEFPNRPINSAKQRWQRLTKRLV